MVNGRPTYFGEDGQKVIYFDDDERSTTPQPHWEVGSLNHVYCMTDPPKFLEDPLCVGERDAVHYARGISNMVAPCPQMVEKWEDDQNNQNILVQCDGTESSRNFITLKINFSLFK